MVFFLLFLLPADTQNERIGRSLFFLVGAVFSGITGYMGMWLAVRGNVRVAAAANTSGEQEAMKIAFRTGGVAGMFTENQLIDAGVNPQARPETVPLEQFVELARRL